MHFQRRRAAFPRSPVQPLKRAQRDLHRWSLAPGVGVAIELALVFQEFHDGGQDCIADSGTSTRIRDCFVDLPREILQLHDLFKVGDGELPQ